MEAKRKILSTAILPESSLLLLEAEGYELEQHAFIDTVPVVNQELQLAIQTMAMQTKNVIITSANAVASVMAQLDGQRPEWRFFCISGKTKDAVAAYWGEEAIIATADHTVALSECILKMPAQEMVFFCGNKRLDTMPRILKEQGFDLLEYEVYQTYDTTHAFDTTFDAILFFSPSGVDSFLKENTFPPQAILFSIGPTTAQKLKAVSHNKVLEAARPDKTLLIQTLIDYYKK